MFVVPATVAIVKKQIPRAISNVQSCVISRAILNLENIDLDTEEIAKTNTKASIPDNK